MCHRISSRRRKGATHTESHRPSVRHCVCVCVHVVVCVCLQTCEHVWYVDICVVVCDSIAKHVCMFVRVMHSIAKRVCVCVFVHDSIAKSCLQLSPQRASCQS